jgi:hypothetical protein
MSICYYLFAINSKKCLDLGRKGKREDSEYDGPVIFLPEGKYYLPFEYLELLIERFTEENGSDNIICLPDYELFDEYEYIKENDNYDIIGGDREFDTPIKKYLPELSNLEFQKKIQSRKDLRI